MKVTRVEAEPQPFNVTLRVETVEDVEKLAALAHSLNLKEALVEAAKAELAKHGLKNLLQ